MTYDWTALDSELAAWRDAGLVLPLWWRDDDAVSDTPALHRLADMSDNLRLPVHLAVVPATADQSLADHVAATRRLIPVVHGWAHANHAQPGEKKAEFGATRPTGDMRDDASRGLERLRGLFGDRLCPIFVPPWNRIAPQAVARLPDLGYRALSTFTPRKAALAAEGLAQVNTHLDPIHWRGDRSVVEPAQLVAQVAGQLRDRREGRADNDEPYGILTHHLVHDAAIWSFTEELITRLMAGPVRVWTLPDTDKGH